MQLGRGRSPLSGVRDKAVKGGDTTRDWLRGVAAFLGLRNRQTACGSREKRPASKFWLLAIYGNGKSLRSYSSGTGMIAVGVL
jgi:hypothetical protein